MNVEIIKVIKIEATEGKGITEDPVRIVYYYYTENGELLLRKDSWEENYVK